MKRLLRYRILYIIISVFCALNALVFVFIGALKAIHGYTVIIRAFATGEPGGAGLYLLQSLDSFLIGLVLLIFAFGIYRIFVQHQEQEGLPPWLHEINNLRDLKLMLWEAIIMVMLIFSMSYMYTHRAEANWTFLILPGVIFLVAISYFLMKKAGK